MSPEVLLVFYCRTGTTESLALRAAVGAVQARAQIRLRRLPDATAAVELPGEPENLQRMAKEYIAPTETDFIRADAVIFAAPDGFAPDDIEWVECFKVLRRLQSEGKLAGKVAATLAETDPARIALSEAIRGLGFTLVPADSPDPLSHGRRTAQEVRK